MFELYEKVKIKSNNIIGIIVDIATVNGKDIYTVESSEKNISDGYGGEWKLFSCTFDEIEKIVL
ncbi:hypothetical protein [Ruminococcus sp.]|jgi:hypothetical protein|uniref:hypothetical protein n=1 Tax=Ruminococcus sp. TaxID=41978 RepID=UPI00205B1DAC|nr:MAG TPA: hypothetical protein [Caudoviricetes sp.]